MSALRVCVLRGWRGNNILCVTDQSEIHTNYTHTPGDDTHTDSQVNQPSPLMMSHIDDDDDDDDDDDCEEAEPEKVPVQSSVKVKRSRIISYQVKYRKG